ncbi:DUF2280 domain-containing protein [Bordetella genomosp. 2]|uniref:DUF2280 domain-containing protein n=1 Tax=Bordetella genomosp. 2 TaxID=1983456 RepID=A0A261W1J0_9BORD|nr:DUF2280 domain-containing protein [Bordetella genomosp. 2]OZI79901.1 hypothetical protein CAL24_08300 [Bordetella genomosp. 2]
MARLNDAQKRYIVQALACYDTPAQVAEAVKEEFGLDVHRAQVAQYDPTKVSGQDLAKKWRDLFDDTRKRFRDEVAEIPIADQAYRLRTLQRAMAKAERQGNVAMVSQLLEQAAKEVGGAFTNRHKHEHGGPNGGPIPTANLSKEEFREIARELLDEV